MAIKSKKKLIEVALPLNTINVAAAREKSIRHGHPSTLHLWWARRPLAAARAVIFAQMVDDPSSLPDLFPTEKKQEKERQRLFKIIEDLVQWESTTNDEILEKARNEIWQSWRRACSENADHPRAKDIFDRNKLPAFHDPFAGGGALPLEAQRLGLDSYSSDLNPVAVLINKAMIEIPPKFNGIPPVNNKSRKDSQLFLKKWQGVTGIAEDIRFYGKWIRDEAEKRIGQIYPKIEITTQMATERKDLKPLIGKQLTIIAWLWARTVKSPNPAFSNIDVPLISTFTLSSKPGKEVFVEPIIEKKAYRFSVKVGKSKQPEQTKWGTKSGSSGSTFLCLLSGTPMTFEYLRGEAKAGRLGTRLMAIVAEGESGRVYLSPTAQQEELSKVEPNWLPDLEIVPGMSERVVGYGFNRYSNLFTNRQLVALTTFSDLIKDVEKKVKEDALVNGMKEGKCLNEGGVGASAYAEAISLYLAFALDKVADRGCSLARWDPTPTQSGIINAFSRQGLPMTWDFAESNPLGDASGNFRSSVELVAKSLVVCSCYTTGSAYQANASAQTLSFDKIVSTDPPYYDNIGYADLSDFFYVWLRRSLRSVYPDLFGTIAVPKEGELVATPTRHGGKEKAEVYFLNGMKKAMYQLSQQAHPAFPVTIYYAFKQSETQNSEGTASTGWETFLEAVILAGFAITGTWPMRTELSNRIISSGKNALASSIILTCRKRFENEPKTTRREFLSTLKVELPKALIHLQHGNIAPVDLAQAAIGPGIGVFTRYSSVLDAQGIAMTVREALALINQTLDESLAQQEGDFDADSRWALTWFEQSGFEEGEYGIAEQLSKSKNTSVQGLVEARILKSKRGKVRLLRPEELSEDWDPNEDKRLTNWETVHHLIRVIANGGESAAADLINKLGIKAETAKELCYRLYTICERKKRTTEALAYNGLVQSWPEIVRLSVEKGKKASEQTTLFNKE